VTVAPGDPLVAALVTLGADQPISPSALDIGLYQKLQNCLRQGSWVSRNLFSVIGFSHNPG
jgi:hypothetical protein